jgi:hypothetical protein
MEKRTLQQLDAALDAVSKDLAPRVEELAQKSTNGVLTPEEYQEYAEVVRLTTCSPRSSSKPRSSGRFVRRRETFERWRAGDRPHLRRYGTLSRPGPVDAGFRRRRT